MHSNPRSRTICLPQVSHGQVELLAWLEQRGALYAHSHRSHAVVCLVGCDPL